MLSKKHSNVYINSLKNSSSSGDDNITAIDIKMVYKIVEDKILAHVNQCIQTDDCPSKLKISKVIPVFKKVRRDNVVNYRPISLISTKSKIMENIIKMSYWNFWRFQRINMLCNREATGDKK